MKMMKFLFAALLFCIVSCSSGTSAEEIQTPDRPTTEAGKTLIVYFSWSGNTRAVANTIQELTG